MKVSFNSILKIKHNKWDKAFKNGPNKICGRQPLKNLKWYGQAKSLQIFKGCLPQDLINPSLNKMAQTSYLLSLYHPFPVFYNIFFHVT